MKVDQKLAFRLKFTVVHLSVILSFTQKQPRDQFILSFLVQIFTINLNTEILKI